jgi:hypothetical protein
MKDSRQNPSLFQIIWTDYPAFLACAVAIVAWIVYFAWIPDWRGRGPVIPPSVAPFYLTLAIVATVVGLGVLVWRIGLLWRAFRSGMQVRGKISSVYLRRDRGRVEYTYIYASQEFKSGVEIHRTKQTKALKTGDRVILMVDRSNPKRAFIRDLYL